MFDTHTSLLLKKIKLLNEVGVALSAEKDIHALLEKILMGAKELTNADAGTLYLLKHEQLHFSILYNDSLGLKIGGSSGEKIPFTAVPLKLDDGRNNLQNVVSYAVLNKKTVNIADAYNAPGFDFSRTREVDAQSNYRSQSFLTIPLLNHNQEVIGCLQLINRLNQGKTPIPFDQEDEELCASLASQAAIALTNRSLIADQKMLFEDFIRLIAKAIDEKSAHTGNHCTRVPILSMMIADALNACSDGDLKDIAFSDEEYEELKIAAWLHDCGKVATPDQVMDKATKLQQVIDRIEVIALRFEVLKRDLTIKHAQHKIADEEYQTQIQQWQSDLHFLRAMNFGGENLLKADALRIKQIANDYVFNFDDQEHPLITDEELENLLVKRGTLNNRERQIINQHVDITLRMLESLHYPKHLQRVPEIAGSHHEHLDGTGFPRGLKGNEMILQSRIVALADVFEALTAADRPYKKAKPLSESLELLGKMCEQNHVDGKLFKLFVNEGVYLEYAKKYLKPEQIDDVDLMSLPGLAG